jgi:hypothetical protein
MCNAIRQSHTAHRLCFNWYKALLFRSGHPARMQRGTFRSSEGPPYEGNFREPEIDLRNAPNVPGTSPAIYANLIAAKPRGWRRWNPSQAMVSGIGFVISK